MQQRAMLVLALALSLVSLPSAGAFHGGPIVSETGGEGSGWVAYRVQGDGQEVTARMDLLDAPLPLHVGYLVMDAQGRTLSGVIALFAGLDAGLQVSTTGLDGQPTGLDHQLAPERGDGWFGVSTARSSEVVIALWSASEQAGWEATLQVEGEAELLSRAQGGDAFLYEAADLHGPLAAHAAAGVPGARAHVLSERVVDIEGGLAGLYWPQGQGLQQATLETPRGSAECPCTLAHPFQTWGSGQGEHVFSLTGAGASVDNGEAYVAGADLHLPP